MKTERYIPPATTLPLPKQNPSLYDWIGKKVEVQTSYGTLIWGTLDGLSSLGFIQVAGEYNINLYRVEYIRLPNKKTKKERS